MNDDNPTNHRDEVLARFRESISRPMDQRFFDEDELLEVFDFAGDVNNDYLRLEALLCAAHFYPDSEEFRERKAVYYSQCGDEYRDSYLDDNTEATGMIWDLLRLRRRFDGDTKQALAEIDDIVDRYDDLTDEEIIQLVDVVSAIGAMNWLSKNMPKLRAKAGYLNILLFEVAIAADLNGDAQFSVKMLEELTELEPFNAYYWMMLAKEYAEVDLQEEAESAIDYSLAIDPNDPQALLIKARLLYAAARNDSEVIEEVIELLEKALGGDGDNLDAAKFLAAIHNSNGRREKAAAILHGYLMSHQSDALNIIPELVMYMPEDTDELLDTFYRYNNDNSKLLWMTWSHQLMANGMPALSGKVIEAYQRNSGVRIDNMTSIETLFIEERFEEALETLGNYLESNDDVSGELPVMAIIHLLCLLKMGEYEKSRSFCVFLESTTSPDQCQTLAHRIEYLGMRSILEKVKSQLDDGNYDRRYWSDFDPLGLWKKGRS